MTDNTPITNIKIKLKTISLDRTSLLTLGRIVLKAVEDETPLWIRLNIAGKSEEIAAESVESFANVRLPNELGSIYFMARSLNNREIEFHVFDIGTIISFHSVEVSGRNVDWVSARVRELENFISDHRNFHWVFQNWWSLLVQATLMGWIISLNLMNQFWGVPLAIVIVAIYISVVRVIFPFVVLDSERPSTLKTIRHILTIGIPALFIGLLANLLSKLLWPS